MDGQEAPSDMQYGSLEKDNVIYDERNVEKVIDVLRGRVKSLRNASYISLGLMFISMVGGSAIFLEAGSIVAKENLFSYQRATGIRESLQAVKTDISLLKNEWSLKGLSDEKNKEILSKLDRLVNVVSEVAPASQKIVEAMPEELKNKATIDDKISIFAMITRMSAGILLIFLVQILVKLYRYSVRVASFYEGRADALQLASNLTSSAIERAAKLLSPDSIDFGEMPEPPTKQALELVKQVGSLLKK